MRPRTVIDCTENLACSNFFLGCVSTFGVLYRVDVVLYAHYMSGLFLYLFRLLINVYTA